MWNPLLIKKNLLFALLIAAFAIITCEPAVAKIIKPSAADLDWLASNAGYVQGAMESPKGPLILDDWQEAVCNYEGKFLCGLKTRQGGWSYGAIAARALAKSQLVKNNLSVIVSINLDDAKEKIRYASELYDTIRPEYRSRLITRNKMQLEFANGSRIVSMFMPRGKGPADVYLDEFAFNKRAREIYKAAIFMTLRGGQLFVGSTPLSSAGMFWEIVTNAQNKFSLYHRLNVPWWHCTALCKDVPRAKLEAPLMTTHERVYAFGTEELISIFESTYLDDFCQECELKPQDDEQSFFPMELLFRCVDPDENYGFYKDFEEFRKNLRGIPYAGFDVGRRKNPSVLAILELLGDKYYLRMLIPMHKMGFDEQKFQLTEALRILPIPRMCIDETGIGMNLAEDLQKYYPHIVVPVNFAGSVDARAAEIKAQSIGDKDKKAKVTVKERLMTNVKIAMERGNFVMNQDRDTIKEFHSIKRETSAGGTMVYAVEKNEQHHADRAWAIALGMFEYKPRASGFITPFAFPKFGGRS